MPDPQPKRNATAEAPHPATARFTAFEAPFLHAPEGARTIFLVTAAAACGPLAAGAVLFGWRALAVAALSVVSCMTIEGLFYRVARLPSLAGRTHACLTGLLLALTLPAWVPWYVPVIAAAFAVIVGKAVFGGVGHFLWQPALVGRLAVGVLLPTVLAAPPGGAPHTGPVLAQNRLVVGDVRKAVRVERLPQWRGAAAGHGADAFSLPLPAYTLRGLTDAEGPRFGSLAYPRPDMPAAAPSALQQLPALNDLFYGARPGGIGETCIIIIIVAGLYLVYRHYVKWQLPLAIVLGAWIVAAIAPIHLLGPNSSTETVWWPLLAGHLEGGLPADLRFQLGFTYVNYQVLSGELMLAAFFLAPEMTSRPVTLGGQVLFGLGCGAVGMLLHLYFDSPIPFYLGVLAMNTLTPAIDAIWRPRVFGRGWFWWLRRS